MTDKYEQPGRDIHKYMDGYDYSIMNDRYGFIADNLKATYTHPYRAGRIAGHKELQLLNLLNGNK